MSLEHPIGNIGDALRKQQEEAARREAERARRRGDAPEAPPPSESPAEPPEESGEEPKILEPLNLGRRRTAPEAAAETSRAAPEAQEPEWSPEEATRISQIRAGLVSLQELKTREGHLETQELETLRGLLEELVKITSGEFGLGLGEYHAWFEESNDPRRGRSFISRVPGRKLIILDRAAAQAPVPGRRYKVRVVKDTAPGERHGVMFVDFVPEAGGAA